MRTIKGAYTSFLTELVNKVNSNQVVTVADWIALITLKYDPLTLAMNDLGAKIDALPLTNYLIDNFGNILTSPLGERILAS